MTVAKIPDLASKCLKTEASFLAKQRAILQSLHPNATPPFSTHKSEVSSALTIITDPSWTWKLNHTVCFGINLDDLETSNDYKEELEKIERVYQDAGLSPQFNMCELADPKAVELLIEKGYENNGHLETFCKALHPVPTSETTGDEVIAGGICIEEANDKDRFVELSVEGFLSGGRSPALLTVLARAAVTREDMKLFFAKIDGQIVGCAGIAIMELEDGVKTAYLCIDSTLPASRGKGVHVALLKHRIRVAEEAGCEVVLCAARQGSGSGRNIKRAGMSTIYKTETYTK